MTLTAHITAAIDDLAWCSTIPHTIDQVVGIYIEATSNAGRPMTHGLTNDEILATIAARGGGGGKGGHSDPTARAALWGEADAVDDADETIRSITVAIDQLVDDANELDRRVARPWDPPIPTGRTERVSYVIARLHHARPQLDGALDVAGPDDVLELTILARTAIAGTAEWLRTKAEGIWSAHHGDRLPVAVQKRIAECSNCARWHSGTMAVDAGLCRQCADYRRAHPGCMRTEAIVRRHDYGKQATPTQIFESRVAARGRRTA
jgi:hypothetical protein